MQKKKPKATLDTRFKFSEDSFLARTGGWDSQLRSAIGVDDGEHYLLRLFQKTGTPLDDDLRRLIARSLRRVRRVLSSRRARAVLVEVIEVLEDENEIAVLMLDPGSPILGTSHRTRSRRNSYLTPTARKTFWRNILRIAEGLTLCHDAGIVHGAVSEQVIFSQNEDREDFRLGGFEACIHIGDTELEEPGHPLRPSGAVSFRQDWSDLGRTAAKILDIDGDSSPPISSMERRILDRLTNPPRFQLYDGNVVLSEIADVIDELDRVGSSSEGELVLYPNRPVQQSDLPSLTSGVIDAQNIDALLQFVEEDLLTQGVRAIAISRDVVQIVTDLAIYKVEIVNDCVGMLVEAHKRRPHDNVLNAIEMKHRLQLSRNRGGAEDRVKKLGPAARRWTDLDNSGQATPAHQDISTWYALILLEAFTLLRQQFRSHFVQVRRPPTHADSDLAWVTPRNNPNRDERRKLLGLRPSAEALNRELNQDDGKAAWTLTASSALSVVEERLPILSYERSVQIDGERAFGFTTTQPVIPGQRLFLRPTRDSGLERAVRRRLQNIVAARTNVELLRALDDPAQVAMDEALQDIASPGKPPADLGLDDSKTNAWKAVATGRSINVVVGPPGVGKTFLITQLVKSILALTPDARILISAQNHETLIHMEAELKSALPADSTIVVRVEKARIDEEESTLRASSEMLLREIHEVRPDGPTVTANQRRQIQQTLDPVDSSEELIAQRVYRDTDNLLLRSADITLATTSSYVIEEMIADGEQFDWVIVEEAARANGAELIGALLLGNRRMMIGDHKQLSPFDLHERQKFYNLEHASELLRDAREQLETISDLPAEIDEALEKITSDKLLLEDVLATAARLEEPFRSIAEREERRFKDTGRPSQIVEMLTEQSRMHPAIGQLVSNTFYGEALTPSERVKKRKLTVTSINEFPTSPVVILNLPALGLVKKGRFEQRIRRSYRNETEAIALISAMECLLPLRKEDGTLPTLAILSPYSAQVDHFKSLLNKEIRTDDGTLFGFTSPRQDRQFVYTSDSFQGSEADVVIASLVRNNVLSGPRALGFVKNPQRMNVLLSRARQKLILATSIRFIQDAVNGVDPDHLGGDLGFLRKMIEELGELAGQAFPGVGTGATILEVDDRGRFVR